MKRWHIGTRGWITAVTIGSAVCAACGTSSTGNDAGTDAGGGSDGSFDEATACGVTLCVHNDQPQQCPSCAPSDGDICSPPAAVTCNYTNGCTGAQLEAAMCTCVLPDASAASDASDAGMSSGKAIWSCTLGV